MENKQVETALAQRLKEERALRNPGQPTDPEQPYKTNE